MHMGKKSGIEKWLVIFDELVTARETDAPAVVARRTRVGELLCTTLDRAHEAAVQGSCTRELEMAIGEVARLGAEFVNGRAPEFLLRSALGVCEVAWQHAHLEVNLDELNRTATALANR
jgi:hypothetical protein